MQNILTTIIIAIAFLLVGYLIGKINAENKIPKELKRSLDTSRAVIKGRVAENMAPLLPKFEEQFPQLNIADAKFIGEPIDYLFFEGMSEGRIDKVLFIEVKSGKHPRLNEHESSLKAVIDDAEHKGANIGWREFNA